VLVCDDGLQHLNLGRDFEIAVIDRRGYGNGLALPAGPLREAPRAVDATVRNGAPPAAGEYAMRLAVVRLYALDDPSAAIEPAALAGLRLHALAGIGSPARFFDSLRGLGLDFVAHAFPDHHAFVAADLAFPDCDAVLMTEKDAVKCARFATQARRIAVRVDAVVDDALERLILERLNGLATA
jgi:tetraacyldisaccharide 4'-kinase